MLKKLLEKNKVEGIEFLEKNKKEEGVQVTESVYNIKLLHKEHLKNSFMVKKVRNYYEGKLMAKYLIVPLNVANQQNFH